MVYQIHLYIHIVVFEATDSSAGMHTRGTLRVQQLTCTGIFIVSYANSD